MRLAGIIKQYSNKAIPHEKRITTISGQFDEMPIVCNFRCPYQANVIRMFETTSNPNVANAVQNVVDI